MQSLVHKNVENVLGSTVAQWKMNLSKAFSSQPLVALGNLFNINFVAEWKVKLIFIQQPNNSLECSVLRIIIPNEYNGSIQTKAIPVRPHTTTKDVCRIIAHKSQITNPMDYGLFKLIDGEGKYLIKEFRLSMGDHGRRSCF